MNNSLLKSHVLPIKVLNVLYTIHCWGILLNSPKTVFIAYIYLKRLFERTSTNSFGSSECTASASESTEWGYPLTEVPTSGWGPFWERSLFSSAPGFHCQHSGNLRERFRIVHEHVRSEETRLVLTKRKEFTSLSC